MGHRLENTRYSPVTQNSLQKMVCCLTQIEVNWRFILQKKKKKVIRFQRDVPRSGAMLSGKLILPDSLTKLEGGFLFENCTAIKQVNAGNHLKKIAARTFTGCDALTEVKLPQSITWADEHAFPDTAKVTCENTELVRFGKNGFHYAEQVSVLGTRDYQMTFQVLSLVNEERSRDFHQSIWMPDCCSQL